MAHSIIVIVDDTVGAGRAQGGVVRIAEDDAETFVIPHCGVSAGIDDDRLAGLASGEHPHKNAHENL